MIRYRVDSFDAVSGGRLSMSSVTLHPQCGAARFRATAAQAYRERHEGQ